MFRADQIYTPTRLSKNLGSIMRELTRSPAALLIIRKRGNSFVFVNSSIFEDLVNFRYQVEQARLQSDVASEEFQEFMGMKSGPYLDGSY